VSVINSKGQRPTPRAFHKMTYVKYNTYFLFGGVSCSEEKLSKNTYFLNDLYVFNYLENFWIKPSTGGYIPSGRYKFSLSCN